MSAPAGTTDRHTPPGEIAPTPVKRTLQAAPGEDVQRLLRDNTEAALEIFRGGAPASQSFVYSPHSLQVALAMAFEGARGSTSTQMAQALRFGLARPELHAAFNSLDLALAARSSGKSRLHIINAVFGQKGLAFHQPFVDTAAAYYGAPLSRLDFMGAAQASRAAINQWVALETEDAIPELLPPPVITESTKVVLVNAIRFVGAWQKAFDPGRTRADRFTRLDGGEAQVPLMSATLVAAHGAGPDWKAVELPYAGGELAMLIVVPETARFASLVAELDGARLAAIVAAIQPGGNVTVKLPRFELRTPFRPEEVLKGLGMVDAFMPAADFSGMAGGPGFLHITAVVHEAVVKVDEVGTEAAAATAVVFGDGAAPPPPVLVAADRPFLFFIRDRVTGAILFLGRFLGPE